MRNRVLIVDGSRAARVMACAVLTDAGYLVRQASNGAEALAHLAAGPIDVVVTEIDMPGIDGFALLERMRSSARLQSIPVIVLTTVAAAQEKERGRKSGAALWIVKPYSPERLLTAVAKSIRARRP